MAFQLGHQQTLKAISELFDQKFNAKNTQVKPPLFSFIVKKIN